MSTAIIIDTEVNSLEKLEPIEVAWSPFEVTGIGNVCINRYRPEHPIEAGTIVVHRILPLDVEACEPSSKAKREVPDCKFWIGHNIDFDWDVLGKPNVKRICTLALSQSIWPDFKSHKLGALAYELFGKTPETLSRVDDTHNAGADVRLCGDILTEILKQLDVADLDALWEVSEEARVPKVMRFGKHKGKLIGEVPADYKSWLLRQDDVDPYLRKALSR